MKIRGRKRENRKQTSRVDAKRGQIKASRGHEE
jgi:hypothetical protein